MKKTIYLLFLIGTQLYGQQVLTVSENGLYKTLHEAYDAIYTTNNVIYQSYEIIIDSEEIQISSSDLPLHWEKSGTEDLYIKVYPSYNYRYAVLKKKDDIHPHTTAIVLNDVKNVHFEGLTFDDAQAGIQLYGTEDCSIKSCRFIVSNFHSASGSASIELKGDGTISNYCLNNLIEFN